MAIIPTPAFFFVRFGEAYQERVLSLSLLSSIPVRVWVYFTELPLLLKYSFRRCIVWGNVRTSILLSCLAPCCRLVIVIPKLTRLNVVREKII